MCLKTSYFLKKNSYNLQLLGAPHRPHNPVCLRRLWVPPPGTLNHPPPNCKILAVPLGWLEHTVIFHVKCFWLLRFIKRSYPNLQQFYCDIKTDASTLCSFLIAHCCVLGTKLNFSESLIFLNIKLLGRSIFLDSRNCAKYMLGFYCFFFRKQG